MAKRDLTKVEKFFIEQNRDMSDAEVAKIMAGIGVKTVEEYRKTIPEPEVEADAVPVSKPGQDPKDRYEDIVKSGITAAKLIGSDEERGITVMTESASELDDARRFTRGAKLTKEEYIISRRDAIHVIKP